MRNLPPQFIAELNKDTMSNIVLISVVALLSNLIFIPYEAIKISDHLAAVLISRGVAISAVSALILLYYLAEETLMKFFQDFLFIVVVLITLPVALNGALFSGFGSTYYLGLFQIEIAIAIFIPFTRTRFISVILLMNAMYYFMNILLADFSDNADFFKILLSMTIFMLMSFAAYHIILMSKYKTYLRRMEEAGHAAEIAEKNERLIVLNDRLLESNEDKNALFTVIAHDLRNPLQEIFFLTELMVKKGINYDKQKLQRTFYDLSYSVQSLNEMLNNLLDWSKTMSGHITFSPSAINLKKTVEEALKAYLITAGRKNIKVNISVPDDIEVMADEQMLLTILRNIAGNAMKFTYEGGIVSIKAFETENSIFLSFKDNGIGMSEELVRAVSESNEIKSRSGTLREIGTGLGLTICKDFIKKNGGELLIKSKENIGSEISVVLPK